MYRSEFLSFKMLLNTFPFLLILLYSTAEAHVKHSIKPLEEDELIRCCQFPRNELDIYCYEGRPKHIVHIWETVQLFLTLNPENYEHFHGCSPEEVIDKFETHKSTWSFNFYLMKKKFIKLDPFNKTCIGIVTQDNYDVKLNRIRVDYWRILLFVCGLVLFLSAPKLSSNSLFYYLTGISFGTCASILILIYVMSKVFPRKPVMYSFLAGGWTIGLYLAQLVFDNIRTVVLQYKMYVVYYILVTGFVSFVVCYRLGPVSDPRSINLIKWVLQVVALAMIFLSSDFQEASMGLSLVLLLCYNLPIQLMFSSCFKLLTWMKPIKPKLLTEDEYHQQGAVETEKALDELRGYCSSPDCNQWRTVLKLKEPLRFAKFVEGNSHLDDEEVLAFHQEDIKTMSLEEELFSDDSSD